MLGIEFAMLKIDILESNLLPFFFAIFVCVLLLGIDMFYIFLDYFELLEFLGKPYF